MKIEINKKPLITEMTHHAYMKDLDRRNALRLLLQMFVNIPPSEDLKQELQEVEARIKRYEDFQKLKELRFFI